MGSIESKLSNLGLELPPPRKPPVANLVTTVRVGNLLFVSGHGPFTSEGLAYQGKVGRELAVEQGYHAAKLACLSSLSSVKAALGSLDRVRRVVKLLGFVNSAEGFYRQPEVVNGASDLLVSLYGDRGRHARSAVGVAELSNSIPVEIEIIFEIE